MTAFAILILLWWTPQTTINVVQYKMTAVDCDTQGKKFKATGTQAQPRDYFCVQIPQ